MLPLDPAEYKFNLKAADNGNEIATVITQSEGTFNQKNTIVRFRMYKIALERIAQHALCG